MFIMSIIIFSKAITNYGFYLFLLEYYIYFLINNKNFVLNNFKFKL